MKIKKLILVSIFCSCLVGFYFEIRNLAQIYRTKDITFYKSLTIANYNVFATVAYKTLEDSPIIKEVRQRLPRNSTVGYYSDSIYGYNYMMYGVLQNVLAPTLLDRHHYKTHRYIIMFLLHENPDKVALQCNKRNVRYLRYHLYLASD